MIAGSVKNTIRFCWEAGKRNRVFMSVTAYPYRHIFYNYANIA